MNSVKIKRYDTIKRISDFLIAIIGIAILLPVYILIILFLKLETPKSKIIFRQERIGKNGKRFYMLKFRSLKDGAPKYIPSCKLEEDFVTKVGRVIRITGLDELPQLINVLLGDMSIVGPRPLIPEEKIVHQYRMQEGIYLIKPGITGLAQINGGNSITDIEKVLWDRNYLLNRSIVLDFKICIKTVILCISGNNISLKN